MTADYTYSATVAGAIDEVRPRVEAALKGEGFGILTEIDLAAAFKAKLGIERAPYLILGACNPGLANQAVQIDPSIGALLPCNVVLRQADDRATTIVEILDPIVALGIAGSADLEPMAAEAAERLRRALGVIAG